jgi:Leucine-rich repeat (LRR) protein
MLNLSIEILLFIICLIANLNAEIIHLNKINLANICECNPFESTTIYLSGKVIATIDPSTFNGLTSLQVLYLDLNQITSIEASTFTGLTSLQTIYLQHNNIKSKLILYYFY